MKVVLSGLSNLEQMQNTVDTFSRGEPLSEDQLRSLVSEMIEKKVTPTCPHGRPLVVSVSRRELERKFKRIQD